MPHLHHTCSSNALSLRKRWKRERSGEGQQNPVTRHGRASVQWQVKRTRLGKGGSLMGYSTENSTERVKGTELQFFHGIEFGRHPMQCSSVKQQAWDKGKDGHCTDSTSLNGRGGTHPAAEFGPLADCAEVLHDHKGKITKQLFCRSHRSSSWQGLVPQRWHKAYYLTKHSRMFE